MYCLYQARKHTCTYNTYSTSSLLPFQHPPNALTPAVSTLRLLLVQHPQVHSHQRSGSSPAAFSPCPFNTPQVHSHSRSAHSVPCSFCIPQHPAFSPLFVQHPPVQLQLRSGPSLGTVRHCPFETPQCNNTCSRGQALALLSLLLVQHPPVHLQLRSV